jgi:hypothetical protein
MGVRIFNEIPGRIAIFTFVLFLINRKEVLRMKPKVWRSFFYVIGIYLLFSLIKEAKPWTPYIFAWSSALFTMSSYINGCPYFTEDLYRLSKFSVIYSLLHVIIQLLLPPLVTQTHLPMTPKTFLYLFYYNREGGILWLNRIQGYCWEPSNWNLVLNTNLALCLYLNKPFKEIFLAILAVICVMSTTGIVVMACTLLLYYLIFSEMSKLRRIIIIAFGVLLLGGFASTELSNKLSSSSGEARNADFYAATAIVQQNPILGADMNNIENNKYVILARSLSMEEGEFSDPGLMEREGFVNSFASLFVEFGTPLAFLILYALVRSPIFGDKKLSLFYSLVVMLVIMGTPISRTGYFFMYVLSFFLMPRKKKKGIHHLKFHHTLK